MNLAKVIATNIKSIRKRDKLSQRELSEKTGLSIRYISKVENSEPNLTLQVLERLAQGLECSPRELVTDPKDRGLKRSKTLSKSVDEAVKTLKRIQTMIED